MSRDLEIAIQNIGEERRRKEKEGRENTNDVTVDQSVNYENRYPERKRKKPGKFWEGEAEKKQSKEDKKAFS